MPRQEKRIVHVDPLYIKRKCMQVCVFYCFRVLCAQDPCCRVPGIDKKLFPCLFIFFIQADKFIDGKIDFKPYLQLNDVVCSRI